MCEIKERCDLYFGFRSSLVLLCTLIIVIPAILSPVNQFDISGKRVLPQKKTALR